MRNIFVLTGLAVAVIGMGFITVTQVTAADENPRDTLVQKLATKFNLNKADVQSVFDEHHAEMHQRMRERYEAYLSQLVSDGKITEAQKALLIAKHAELAKDIKDTNQSPEERKQVMEAKRTELEAWAKENGIDLQYLKGPLKHGMRGHGLEKSLH